jgi:hypothetical protein
MVDLLGGLISGFQIWQESMNDNIHALYVGIPLRTNIPRHVHEYPIGWMSDGSASLHQTAVGRWYLHWWQCIPPPA